MKTKNVYKNSLIKKTFSKETFNKNKDSLDTYDIYKDTSKRIEEVYKYLGRKLVYKSGNASTLNSKINLNGIDSTQNIQINSRLV